MSKDSEMIAQAKCLLEVLGIDGVLDPLPLWYDNFINTHYLAQQIWAEAEYGS